jgi:hypothetical protein
MLDVTTEWGQHAVQRLRTNIIGWLTTVGSDRRPNRWLPTTLVEFGSLPRNSEAGLNRGESGDMPSYAIECYTSRMFCPDNHVS